MFKKTLHLLLLFNVLVITGLVQANTLGFDLVRGDGDDPPITPFMVGNWNQIVEPDGCIELDENNELEVYIKVTFAVADLSPYPDIYYAPDFNGDVQSGRIRSMDLVPEYLPTGEQVYVFMA